MVFYFVLDEAKKKPIRPPKGCKPKLVTIKNDDEEDYIPDLNKRYNCKYYEDCLTFAACKDKNFHCDNCDNYEFVQPDINVHPFKALNINNLELRPEMWADFEYYI